MDREERRRVAGGEVERIVRMDGCASELGMREAEERRRKRRRRDRNEAVLGGGNSPARKKRLALEKTPCGFRVGLARGSPLGRKESIKRTGFDEIDDEE